MTNPINKLRENAILKFGMKMTMKKKSSCVLLCIILGIAGMVLVITAGSMRASGSSLSEYSEAGQILFTVLSCLHFALGVFLAPAVAGSSISSERERQTFDVMLCSQMTPKNIVTGKFLSSMSWIVLISISTLPVYAAIYIFGGVPAYAIFAVVAYIIWATAVCAAIAVLMSATVKRSAGAIILTYIIVFSIVGANFLLTGIWYALFNFLDAVWIKLNGAYTVYIAFGNTYSSVFNFLGSIVSPVLWFNPIVGFIDVLVNLVFDTDDFVNLFSYLSLSNSINISLVLIIVGNLSLYTFVGWLSLRAAKRSVDPLVPGRDEKRAIKKMKKELKKNRKAAKQAEQVN